ncbi:nicotinamide mononucleotide transporter [Parabacteroides sp. PF5-5]|nr:nicotinamide mononucleotide transporter [Parabacteroides sp. PH5-39]MDH6314835.1 nicotinamide mononucleotide transporter [Parabacteroides sp. PF5-13]MDH6318172.1 nicotinamide mononucleotide transporter [Parabacteroides sp. PH5-13]MDH6321896.1 nicotinamide mononucleotide transporter [Parabacteroides sp. PH5-8]MDH6326020.1 nicotinamide mononucleotide transporter [Parabacteroides sp. PH5-41]MDH6333820.1 nicotinamide mononucleotide transporter [Parabacteroides sp. PF5-5]MDH6344885.1 nicotinami
MLEYFGVITGLIYMILEVKQHPVMWVVGFVTSLVYVFVFFFAKIYADMGLQVYYVLISVYGFWLWMAPPNPLKGGQTEETSSPPPSGGRGVIYRHAGLPLLLGLLALTGGAFGAIYYVLSHFTDSPVPLGDAFTTAVGIVATWMLARRIIEHWYFWIVANAVSIYIYYLRDLYPTMFLYLCYALLSLLGLYTWIKKGTKVNAETI